MDWISKYGSVYGWFRHLWHDSYDAGCLCIVPKRSGRPGDFYEIFGVPHVF